ncbi:probable disease resistance protein At1g58602 [Mercurialis annua]|uniref:probable disease resistance protein At1g58602 n=1 Tax=Mercurialis annua TaxID=3986 RepID=UPI0021609911|nr:probable disease resistance protein At1g58602 [Mercurialis annua]
MGFIKTEPPFLTDEQGWELLRKKAFLDDSTTNMSEFEGLGKQMVRKCEGLPLAITTLGGLLAYKSLKEWRIVEKDVTAQFNKLQERRGYAGVRWILALSYQNLPFRLKPCFLYLSQFPEDFEIRKKRLIRMWIAEGFIPSKGEGDETMEDVGELYLEELANRCMIQVSKRNHTTFGIKTFRIHDLMRDMCLFKAQEEKFLAVIEHQKKKPAADTMSAHSILNTTRRIAYHDEQCQSLHYCGPSLRSLVFLKTYSRCSLGEEDILFIFRRFRLLRVLNLDGIILHSIFLPEQIGNLIHLRYLGLENIIGLKKIRLCKYIVPTLPESIGNLKSLYTLDLRGITAKFPDVLWRLENLRHLLLEENISWKFRLDTLLNLETLKWVKSKNLIRNDAMLKLTNLRHLAIEFQDVESEVILKSPIFGSGRLESLKMKSENSFPNLERISDSHRLTKLLLNGYISENQSLKFLPESLTKLILLNSRLQQDPMSTLEKLPNLRDLQLSDDSYRGRAMVCSAHCFRKLENLSLERLWNVEEWKIQESAMPCVKSLKIFHLESMRMIPDGLRFVSSLQELQVIDDREEFLRRVRVGGQDSYKTSHIPNVSIKAPFR